MSIAPEATSQTESALIIKMSTTELMVCEKYFYTIKPFRLPISKNVQLENAVLIFIVQFIFTKLHY